MSSSRFDLTGRRVVVTGGSSGIGLGAARALCEHGARVAIWGRSPDRLDAALRTFAPGHDVVGASVDVSDETSVVAAFDDVGSAWGGVDVVMANAGLAVDHARIDRSTTESYRTVVGTNLDGAYWTVREGAKAMLRRAETEEAPDGSIILVSSIAARQSAGFHQVYAATKSAVLGLAHGSAVDLARHGIRVNSILPGYIATGLSDGLAFDEHFEAHLRPRVPMRRRGTPEDVAGAVVYLASDASTFQTGSEMVVDGGYSIF